MNVIRIVVGIFAGHRFRTHHDFGFVALDILYTYPADSGTYMCRAVNKNGEAATTCAVTVAGLQSLYLDTMDETRLQKLKQLEAAAPPPHTEEAAAPQRPEFITPLKRYAAK
jgi:hypothetical protein